MRPRGRNRLCLIVTILVLVMPIIRGDIGDPVLASTLKTANKPSKLAYTIRAGDQTTSLIVYDPITGSRRLIRTTIGFNGIPFSFSTDGQLAFSVGTEKNGQLYILDTLSEQSSPVTISPNAKMNDSSLAWSPDGHYLAIESFDNNGHDSIYIWDGKTSINITPKDLPDMVYSFSPAWSLDGRLAFTAWLDSSYPPKGDESEIYLWDGNSPYAAS